MHIALVAVAAFNLACSGTMTTKSISGDESKPYNAIYRIDTEAKKWCEGECKSMHEIAEVQPTEITLENKKVDSPSERSLLVNRIDRETGKHTITSTYSMLHVRGMIIVSDFSGQCEPSSFTGFPKFETKF